MGQEWMRIAASACPNGSRQAQTRQSCSMRERIPCGSILTCKQFTDGCRGRFGSAELRVFRLSGSLNQSFAGKSLK